MQITNSFLICTTATTVSAMDIHHCQKCVKIRVFVAESSAEHLLCTTKLELFAILLDHDHMYKYQMLTVKSHQNHGSLLL